MAPLNCCSFRRNVSPDPQPIRLVDTSQPNKRFALSSHSITPTENARDVTPTQDIPTSASEENGRNDSSTTSGHELLSLHDTGAGTRRRESSRRVHGVASQVRKRMSRDSGMSKRSSRGALRASTSFQDTERRAELKRALHRRVKDSLLDDSTTDDDHYDEDAVPIITPKDTLGRHEGSIQISPKDLRNVLKRSDSPSHSLHTEPNRRKISQIYASNDTATALSRMLTQRAGTLSEENGDMVTEAVAETPKRSRSKKYVFEDEETPRPASKTCSQSPIGRTNTVIHAAPNTKQLAPGLQNPSFLYDTGNPLTPSLLPSRTPSSSNSIADKQHRLPLSERGPQNLPANAGPPRRPLAANSISSGVYDTKIRPASEGWLRGASGVLSPSRDTKNISIGHYLGHNRGHSCDPNSEEADFGGVDGKNDSPPVSAYHTARSRNQSEGHEPTASAHIYNTHVPKRLVSKSLLPPVLLPQLEGPRPQRSFTRGGSEAFSVKFQRQQSGSSNANTPSRTLSSRLQCPSIPMAWDNAHWRASSSVYSSQPESLMSSQQSSLQRIASLHDRLQQIKAYTPSEEIISVPASRGRSIDLEKLERQSSDISYRSSSESLIERELAAAETRIAPLPRSSTYPKNSRFKEELDQISAEIALTNPLRRRISNLDGSGEWNRESQAIFDKNAASIWERALREHSQEDAALTHTRLGSEAPEGIGPKDLDTRRSVSARKASMRPPLASSDNLSAGNRQGLSLQERLASYKLPAPAESPPKTRATEETQRPASVRSTSSWARYPSHTRQERSLSPAGEQDQVYTRDFANMTPTPPPGNSATPRGSNRSKDKRTTSFGQQMLSSIKHIYRTQSQELQRRLANEARGHRSSISQGGVLEYPELEMLGSFSPPLPSPDIDRKIELEDVIRKASQPDSLAIKERKSQASRSPFKIKDHRTSEDAARKWSKVYEECVVDPAGDPGLSATSATRLRKSASEGIGPIDKGPRRISRIRAGSRRGSGDLRASTLDFKRSLELDEVGARERLAEMMGGEERKMV